MNITYNKFLIVFTGLVLLGGIYTYFSNSLNVEAETVLPNNSDLSSSQNSSPFVGLRDNSTDSKIASDTAFLLKLATLTSINIDTTIFMNDAFNLLIDNSVVIDPVDPGRINPFAPIGMAVTTNATISISPVVTNEPIQITDKTASFYGTLNSTTIPTSIYFEHGETEALGKLTPQAKLSLVGTFIFNVTGLKSKTEYFYRAVAKISGALLYGEVVSFTTN